MDTSRFDFDAYVHRLPAFKNVSKDEWTDWKWQQQNALRSSKQVRELFPNFPEKQIELAEAWEGKGLRFQLTPYMLSLVELDVQGNPLPHDPIWRQFFPVFESLTSKTKKVPDEYSPDKENWELPQEMLTPIMEHKYDNRAIIYVSDACLGYCMYCFRSLQSNAPQEKHGGKGKYWEKTLEEIKKRPGIEEIILSGGDPMLFDNAILEEMLKDIRSIPTVKCVRIHTRVLTHNPYRIDEKFVGLLSAFELTEIAFHVSHPSELTKDFLDAVQKIRNGKARTLLLAEFPLIKGVNDNSQVLRNLFMGLYGVGIKAYYMFHMMPNIPAASEQRTSVRKGVILMNEIGRKISGPAVPNYVIAHRTGKRTVPQEINGTSEFKYDKDEAGNPVIRFNNWKGNQETYLDGRE